MTKIQNNHWNACSFVHYPQKNSTPKTGLVTKDDESVLEDIGNEKTQGTPNNMPSSNLHSSLDISTTIQTSKKFSKKRRTDHICPVFLFFGVSGANGSGPGRASIICWTTVQRASCVSKRVHAVGLVNFSGVPNPAMCLRGWKNITRISHWRCLGDDIPARFLYETQNQHVI